MACCQKRSACARRLRFSVTMIQQFIESKKWQPVPLPEPAPVLRRFVDWERLGTTLETAAGSTFWVGLRAVSLSYWLKGVVNEEGIR